MTWQELGMLVAIVAVWGYALAEYLPAISIRRKP